jgi:hypothetical protein
MLFLQPSLARCGWVLAFGLVLATQVPAEEWRDVPLRSRVEGVQPHTGIVLWASGADVDPRTIQLEFSYMKYGDVVTERDRYDWDAVERVLDAIAGRGHQAVLRFYDVYVAKETTVPAYIKALPDYREVEALSENKQTSFSDWSHPELQRFVLEFFSRFAEKYDTDPRLAYLQVGFGLWAEYHIYDGPMELGRTFPDREYQTRFARMMAESFSQTPWMISVDAAGVHAPFAGNKELLSLPFGVFDDSFLCEQHERVNRKDWEKLGLDRWKRAPAGGEFSYYTEHDQRLALGKNGPHGVPFEDAARRYRLTFIIGADQPQYQPLERVREAGMALGYRFRITKFETRADRARVEVTNVGIAPPYHDAWPAINGIRGGESLKGLLPGETRTVEIPAGGTDLKLSIESDRLVPGQRIEFEADLN